MSQLKEAPQVVGPFPLSTLRHSVSHLMASAVAKLYPGVQFGFGPAIEHGFYYDFDLAEPLTEADLRKIEKEMARIAKRSPEMKCVEVTREEARSRLAKAGQTYKVESIGSIGCASTTRYSAPRSASRGRYAADGMRATYARRTGADNAQ